MPRQLAQLERSCQRREDELRRGNGGEREPIDAVAKSVCELRGELQPEPRLPGPSGTREREEPDAVAHQERLGFAELAPSADERCRLYGKVGSVERLERRVLLASDLVEAKRPREILEQVLAEVSQRNLRRQVAAHEDLCRLGHQHLATVSRSHDARRAMHVDPDIEATADDGLTRVDANANLDRVALPTVRLQRALCLVGRKHGVGAVREREEERVALHLHLDAVEPRERLAEQPTMVVERSDVWIPAEALEKSRRPLDVSEQESDRPSR